MCIPCRNKSKLFYFNLKMTTKSTDGETLSSESNFMVSEGFCSVCGTILPLVDSELVNCYVCSTKYNITALGSMDAHYKIHFNKLDRYLEKNDNEEGRADGPVVERKCPKCGNETMSYATLQLRSADEGQTVFFTCTQCKHKETENS